MVAAVTLQGRIIFFQHKIHIILGIPIFIYVLIFLDRGTGGRIEKDNGNPSLKA